MGGICIGGIEYKGRQLGASKIAFKRGMNDQNVPQRLKRQESWLECVRLLERWPGIYGADLFNSLLTQGIEAALGYGATGWGRKLRFLNGLQSTGYTALPGSLKEVC